MRTTRFDSGRRFVYSVTAMRPRRLHPASSVSFSTWSWYTCRYRLFVQTLLINDRLSPLGPVSHSFFMCSVHLSSCEARLSPRLPPLHRPSPSPPSTADTSVPQRASSPSSVPPTHNTSPRSVDLQFLPSPFFEIHFANTPPPPPPSRAHSWRLRSHPSWPGPSSR